MKNTEINKMISFLIKKGVYLPFAILLLSSCTRNFPDNNWLYFLMLDSVVSPVTPPTVSGKASLSTNVVIVSEEQTVPSASFTVVLDTAVAAGQTVAIPVTGSAAEGQVSSPLDASWVAGPIILTFDDANWNVPQTVFVKGVDTDTVIDASPYTQFTVNLGIVTTGDPAYTGYNPPDVAGFNLDNDTPGTPGVTIVPASGLFTSEPGDTVQFGVVLNKQPVVSSTVDITFATSDATEGDVSIPATKTLSFNDANWYIPQNVTVKGADDSFVDVNTPYILSLDASASSDPAYAALVPGSAALPDVNLYNKDNDTAGVKLNVNSITTSETGTPASVIVSLDAAPAAGTQVQIDITGIDASEGTLSTPAPGFLVFTDVAPGPKTITITGADDPNDDGNITYPVTLSINAVGTTDPAYSALSVPGFSVTNTDNETAGITVNPAAAGSLPEDGTATAAFTIVLNTEPLFPVTVNVYSNDTTEASIDVTAALTFSAACPGATCWSTPRTVTITGVDDLLADGTQNWKIITDAASSSDPAYNGLNPADVTGSTTDDDTIGFTVWDPGTAGFTINENLGADLLTIRLNTQPDGDVVIPYSLNSALPGHEVVYINGIPSANSGNIIFTPTNWYVSQSVIILSVPDTTMDRAPNAGNPTFSFVFSPVAASSTDTTGYVGQTVPGNPFAGVNIEDEKYMFITDPILPNFDAIASLDKTINTSLPFNSKNGDLNGIPEADNWCRATGVYPGAGTYKAFITAPGIRIASVTANAGDGQIDWVLKPNTTYYNTAGLRITNTNGSSLFNFPFTNGMTAVLGNHYTGMLADWTTPVSSLATCGLYWNNATSTFNSGLNESLNASFVGGAVFNCDGTSAYAENLICVEQ